jgi:phosphate/sulfate permease
VGNQIPETDYSFELYKALIDETRNLHTQWINNFRVILTFNSILMAGLIAIIIVFAKGEAKNDFISLIRVTLIILPILGISITMLGIRIINRLYESYKLRYEELRFIEIKLSDRLPLLPYCEGNKKFLNKTEDGNIKAKPLDTVSSIKPQKVNGHLAYKLIALGFILAYFSVSIFQFSIKSDNSTVNIESSIQALHTDYLKTIKSFKESNNKSIDAVESIKAQLHHLNKNVVELKLAIEQIQLKSHNQANSADVKSHAAD